jgi:hypothetical protein
VEQGGGAKIDPATVALHADIAPALGGAADWSQVVTIDLEKLPEEFRLQRLVFKAAQRAFELLQEQFKGQREYLLFQLVRLVEEFLASNKIEHSRRCSIKTHCASGSCFAAHRPDHPALDEVRGGAEHAEAGAGV